MKTQFPPVLEVGARVWTEHGYPQHGPRASGKVDIAPKMAGVIVRTESALMDQLLYVVHWDNRQASEHYNRELFCIGRFASYDEFEAAISIEREVHLTVGPQGGFREACARIKYDGTGQDARLTKENQDLWERCIQPLARRTGITIKTTQLAPKGRRSTK